MALLFYIGYWYYYNIWVYTFKEIFKNGCLKKYFVFKIKSNQTSWREYHIEIVNFEYLLCIKTTGMLKQYNMVLIEKQYIIQNIKNIEGSLKTNCPDVYYLSEYTPQYL